MPRVSAAHHRLGERMLGAFLGAGRPAQHVLLGRAVERHHVGHLEAPARERAGLVECHGLHAAQGLDEAAALEQDAVAGGVGDRREDGGGGRDHQRARRCHHQQHHGAIERGDQVAAHHQRGHDHHEHRADDDHHRVVAPHPLRQLLGLRLLFLRLLDQRHDAGERRVAGGAARHHLDRALLVEGAGEDPVARPLLDRHRFAGEAALVHQRGAEGHLAVHRYRLARLDDHALAHAHRFRLDLDLLPVATHQGPRGAKLEQGVQRPARAPHGVDLERVAEREQEHQHRRLEQVSDRAGADGGEDHEQVDVEAQPGEGRHRRAQREPAAGDGRAEIGGVGPRLRGPCALEHHARDQQRQAGAREHGHRPAARELVHLGGREGGAPRLAARQRPHQLGGVGGHAASRQPDPARLGGHGELVGARAVAEPQVALMAGTLGLATLAVGDPLGEQGSHLVRQRVQAVGLDLRWPVADGERVVAEVRDDRHHARALAQAIGEDGETARIIRREGQVLHALGQGRRALDRGAHARTLAQAMERTRRAQSRRRGA
jgi:hypothetical protein